MPGVRIEGDGQTWKLRRPCLGETVMWNGLVHIVCGLSGGSGWHGTTHFGCGSHDDTVFRMEEESLDISCLPCMVHWLMR